MTSKNRTYERALNAFFNDSQLTPEQREQLPSEVDGVSVRRKKLILEVLHATSSSSRLRALKQLNQHFGLPSDLQVLSYALTPDDPSLALKALKKLSILMKEEPADVLKAYKDEFLERLSTLEIRLFHEESLELTQQCIRRFRALPISQDGE